MCTHINPFFFRPSTHLLMHTATETFSQLWSNRQSTRKALYCFTDTHLPLPLSPLCVRVPKVSNKTQTQTNASLLIKYIYFLSMNRASFFSLKYWKKCMVCLKLLPKFGQWYYHSWIGFNHHLTTEVNTCNMSHFSSLIPRLKDEPAYLKWSFFARFDFVFDLKAQCMTFKWMK